VAKKAVVIGKDSVMVRERLTALGFSEADAETLAAHFLDAERRGKHGHGLSRVDWLETGPVDFDPAARPRRLLQEPGYERWDATGMLGYWARKLAAGGLVAALTATSPARLGHPEGGPKLAGTNPLAIAIPSSEGDPLVTDVSMGRVTYGDVIAGAASEDELVPFGGEHAHKAFALALGLQLLVDALVAEAGHGAVLVVARPEADPLPALRARAVGVRLPGQS